MFRRADLQRLMTMRADPAITIFMPAHEAGPQIRQDPIRLKNLLSEAEERLTSGGVRRPDVEDLLAPARSLQEDHRFWRYQASGLALFIAPGEFHVHKVPIDLDEKVVIGDRFHVKPLLPVLANDSRFFLLTLTLGRVRLFEGTKFRLDERHPEELPDSLADVTGQIDFQNHLHFHPTGPAGTTTGTPTAKMHGSGDSPEQVREMAMLQFLRKLDDAVTEHLTPEAAPLILAAEERLYGHFRQICKYRWLFDEGLIVNPDSLSDAELHERAYSLLLPSLEEARQQACDQFRALAGDGGERAASDIRAIVADAEAGRVDKLLVAGDIECWGRFDPDTMRAVLHDERQEHDDDLLDLAATKALATGAEVYVVPASQIPSGTPAAAVLRY